MTITMDNKISKKKVESLKKSNEFHEIFKKGRFFVGKQMVLYVLPNQLSSHRVGIVVRKKIGNSVKRNRIRRIIKEVLRNDLSQISELKNLVVVVRKSDSTPDYNQVQKELRYLFKKCNISI